MSQTSTLTFNLVSTSCTPRRSGRLYFMIFLRAQSCPPCLYRRMFRNSRERVDQMNKPIGGHAHLMCHLSVLPVRGGAAQTDDRPAHSVNCSRATTNDSSFDSLATMPSERTLICELVAASRDALAEDDGGRDDFCIQSSVTVVKGSIG